MKRLRVILLSVFVLSVWSSGSVRAQDAGVCPKTLAAISENYLSLTSKKILSAIYESLGCPVEVLDYPGRRGVFSFNSLQVDGEILRFEVVESLYTRRFVRSSRPLFFENGHLWLHPDVSLRETLPIGYLFGIVWHENYMKGRRGKVYNSSDDLLNAYQNGEIGSFLYTDFAMNIRVTAGKIQPVPEKGGRIIHAPFYHYLGAEFTPFMIRLSRYLDEHEPFSFMEIPESGSKQVITLTQ